MATDGRLARKKTGNPSKGGQNKKKPAKKTAPSRPRGERGKLKALLAKVEERLQGEDGTKVSVSDYIRLLQLKRELDQKRPKDVEVRWVDTSGEENATD